MPCSSRRPTPFILACGAVETARLLLLSNVRAVPRRPGQRQRPRRAQRHVPRVLGLGRHLRRPDLRLGRRRLRQRQQLPVLQPRPVPRLRERGAHRRGRCRDPAADQLGDCPVGRRGAQRPSRSTATTSTTAWRSPWCCTTCRSTTTGSDLDDTVVDAWGLPVARITLTPHENDLAQGRFLVDRCGEILEAAGARTVRPCLRGAGHRQLLPPARHDADGRTTPRPRCWTATAAPTRSTTCTWSTAAPSPQQRGPTRR